MGEPAGLQYEVWRDDDFREVLIYVDYLWPDAVCDQPVANQLWLLVERPPGDAGWSYIAFAGGY